jgi:NADPH:quinone reductase-like Zn-dependent oxidoreductase
VELALKGGIHPVVAKIFSLSQAAQAQALLARREHVGKIVLHP